MALELAALDLVALDLVALVLVALVLVVAAPKLEEMAELRLTTSYLELSLLRIRIAAPPSRSSQWQPAVLCEIYATR